MVFVELVVSTDKIMETGYVKYVKTSYFFKYYCSARNSDINSGRNGLSGTKLIQYRTKLI